MRLEVFIPAGYGHICQDLIQPQGGDTGEKIIAVVRPAAHVILLHHFYISEMEKIIYLDF